MANYYLASHHFALTAPTADATSGLAVGDIIGFTCIPDREKGGAPFYKELDGQYLVNLFYNSQADPTAKNPEEELPIILSDYRSGFGLDIQDYNDPKRYFSSYGADLRFKDRATLSYGATSIALPVHTASDYNNPSNYADPSSHWANEANAINGSGADYATGTLQGGTAWTGYIEVYIPAISCNSIKFQWGESGGNFVAGVEADVYYNGAWTNVYSNLANPNPEVVTQALGATYTVTAARFRFQDNSGSGGSARLMYAQFYAVTASIVGTAIKGIDFNDEHYIPMANALYKLNGTGNGFTAVSAFPVTITDVKVFGVSGTDYLLIALGFADNYWYMTAAEAVTESSAANPYYQFFQPVYTTALTLYGNDTNSTIRSTTNPLNGGVAWSAQTQVDSDLYDITGLRSRSGALYIAKEDKPYYLSSAGAVQNDLAPECESSIATTSGKNSDVWLDNWYYPYGAQYLLEIGSSNTRRTPAEYCTNLSDFVGKVAAVTHDGDQWLIACLNNSTKVEVLMGREETIDGSTTWVWHPYRELTMGNCNNAWVSGIYQRRVWIASATASEALQYIPLPTGYGNLTSDANRSFATGGYFETPFLHGKFPADTKGWIKVTATMAHAYDADIYWTIQYKKLQDSGYTNIGNLVGTSTDRTHTLYLPADGSSNNPVSPMMRFKLIGVTDSATTTPVLLNLEVRSVLYPTKKDIIWAKVKIAKEMVSGGGASKDKYAKMKACLDVCRDATYPVTLKDIDGTTTQVRFLQLPQSLPWREPVTDEKGRDYDYVYNVLMLKTPTS